MRWINQKQNAGDGSIVVQAGGHVSLTTGLSATEVRQIAIDVMKANFIEAQGIAKQLVEDRFQLLADAFIEKMADSDSRAEKLQNPDMQYSLAVAGQTYARHGDNNHLEMLADLLVQKVNSDDRSLESVVISEAISTVGRLTALQIEALAAAYALHHMKKGSVNSHERLAKLLRAYLVPLKPGMSVSPTDVAYLVYTGCIQDDYIIPSFGAIFRDKFPSLFQKDLTEEQVSTIPPEIRTEAIIESPVTENCYWISSDSRQSAMAIAERLACPELRILVNQAFSHDRYDPDDQTADVIICKIVPELAEVANSWDGSAFSKINMTPVGATIGRVHWAQKFGMD